MHLLWSKWSLMSYKGTFHAVTSVLFYSVKTIRKNISNNTFSNTILKYVCWQIWRVAILVCHFKPQIQADHAMTSLTLKCSGSQKQRASFPLMHSRLHTHTQHSSWSNYSSALAPPRVPPPSFLLSHSTTTFHLLLLLKLSVPVRLCSRSRSDFPPTAQLYRWHHLFQLISFWALWTSTQLVCLHDMYHSNTASTQYVCGTHQN